jgi:hypothetical protein
MENSMPDTVMFPPAVIADKAGDRVLAAALVREVAAGRHPHVTLAQPLPPAARSAAETLADSLDELDRDLARLRRRHSAPTSAGGRIRLAIAEAELLGGYVRDVLQSLTALRLAGAEVEKAGERSQPSCVDGDRIILRLQW